MTKHLFSGLKVLDVGTYIAGPVAATIMGDFGADVIKIERPGGGDPLRYLSDIPTTPDAPSDYFWQMDGRNKRSLFLDLKSRDGLSILHELVKGCDVYITNQPLRSRRDLGLTYEDLKPLSPSMIYASLTAYGEEGPARDEKGFDLMAYWASSGLMDLVHDPDGVPTWSLPGMGDHPTAVALYASIVTALLHREQTGEGSMAHTSLLANGVWAASAVAQGVLAGGDMERYRAINRQPGQGIRFFRTQDGRWLQFDLTGQGDEFDRLFGALGITHVLEEARAAVQENRQGDPIDLGKIMQEALLKRDSGDWLYSFDVNRIAVSRLPSVEEAMQSEQLTINKIAVAPEDPDVGVPLIINHPVKVEGVDQVGPKRAPFPGEHTVDILRELGLDDDKILLLRELGIVQ